MSATAEADPRSRFPWMAVACVGYSVAVFILAVVGAITGAFGWAQSAVLVLAGVGPSILGIGVLVRTMRDRPGA